MLPILDLGDADTAPATFRAALREAAHDHGFFYLTGHGVPGESLTEVMRLAREFFALPDEAKNEISQLQSPQFRGYSRLGGELTNGKVDWREQIDIGPERAVIPGAEGYWRLQGPNLWPSSPAGFRTAFEDWGAALSEVGLRLLRHWSVSLGAPESFFDAAFAELPATLIKVVRYPGTADSAQGVGAHKDSGVLTLLLVEPGSEGLEVETAAGSWVEVPPVEGAFIVNIGELLEVATGGYLRATRHRVRAPRPGTDRVSIPFFLNPALDEVIPIIDLPPELATASRGVETDPDNPIFSTYGENAWKSRTRAHPDVAELHHGIIPSQPVSAY
ncbi:MULTISPECIES: isopenicillin N synthase family dioxygenase [Gordonia]|jgi:isopenicillin N synthase-like dioxygenase|uniref:Putative isopenicillin N synthase family protein n=1 Tax=Gordonia alkanivorans NBRC 16433 TaxID=1027371 RepID=F9VTU5_9ACTN|nr:MULTISPECIES: 2-oxoglutarate and iron-dependent oxygenase domain-containing protein [Gordonia]AZZ80875.1 isopenicillin N synthase family oxygenase [Gordonia alkanivorans]MDH3012263.1 2-oxoglutarate and iron-dependent oxygenase domain-containing protein [Gordonia alkanivorans]MDH3021070.1 2-oxoglutarate and iron-dependent oxygenase domain-containing protein [Gordonia alkanivorans]MDJ0029095.1 2-oxoglutarate and iron-dependent oxygenase domain-containing protein [Gordonia alkanivorans]QGP8972